MKEDGLEISLVVTDLDNTLWPWFEIWYARFSTFLDQLVVKSGIEREVLTSEIKKIHEEHRTTEYSFLLQELPVLKKLHGKTDEFTEIYSSVIKASREARKNASFPYPSVIHTLKSLKEQGIKVIGYTESQAFYTEQRLRTMGFDGLIEIVFTPETLEGQPRSVVEKERNYVKKHYRLKETKIQVLKNRRDKPNPELLSEIITEVGGRIENTCYIGDSLTKDIAMANKLGVVSIFAAYGEAHMDPRYELLRSVTHWKKSAVESELSTTELDVEPCYRLESFSDLLNFVEFIPFSNRS